ncbi:translation initiation factor eIF-2A [Pluteus cervinus]|uniref:Translation initiation factor eIF-2A n=1 Tax=Pluteus cervinus TaxID=181527 RepID=A0ACD3A6R8_9AGAR|nr:translation initiation factor eIF-2A [Pluteus cervinus]
MASQLSQQYAYRAQKSLGLVGGTPSYAPIQGFTSPDVAARTYHYSSDGRLYAYALPNVVRIFQAESAQLIQELAFPNIVELNFSPRGTYLSTWERPVKLEDGAQHKNLRVFSVSTGEELISFYQKGQEQWDLQYTISEQNAIRLVGTDVQVYRPAEWGAGIVDKLKVEGAASVSLSPGLTPSVAVFVAEKKGAPASIRIYNLNALNQPPTCSKSFYKADRAQIKWNSFGTHLLLVTQTEVDNSNKNYYGETGLYLLTANGSFDCRVTLDKEGPIHDSAWNPNSKEFGVVYGFMPAKTMLFDQRVKPLHDFGLSPHNFISFNPQGRLLALAGFGNLAGKIDMFDRRTLNKICTIDAPNTSHCEWSPDGRFLLTATLSPRLRVDNGIKVWHCTGPLMHLESIDELYQVSWRPTPVDLVAPFGQTIPPAPLPSESVKSHEGTQKATPAKPAGAYRPPGARGLATPAIFKREDEGGLPTSGTTTPNRAYNRSPVRGANGASNGRRHVPGAPPPGAEDPDKKNARKRKGKKGGEEGANGEGNGREGNGREGNGREGNGRERHGRLDRVRSPRSSPPPGQNGHPKGNRRHRERDAGPSAAPEGAVEAPPAPPAEPEPADGALDAIAKKVRNLNKKLKAIEELKEKAKRGERLEATQLKKMEGEAVIRKELSELGGVPVVL